MDWIEGEWVLVVKEKIDIIIGWIANVFLLG